MLPFTPFKSQHLPSLLAHIAKPSFLLPLIGAAVLADVVFAVLALSLCIDEKCKRGAATYAAALIKALLLGKDAALVNLFIEFLLHFTGAQKKETKRRENQNDVFVGHSILYTNLLQ